MTMQLTSNIWAPSKHREAIKTIGDHYNFSSRLQALMIASSLPQATQSSPVAPALVQKHIDLEQGWGDDSEKSEPPPRSNDDLDIHQLVKETMHYTSLDQGERCAAPVTSLARVESLG
jgi:hypothetical protein